MLPSLWIATSNSGKLLEFQRLLEGFEIHTPAELKSFFAPPETGKTFLENARIKTKALKAIRNNDWVMGEDAGLEVAGLGGLPGVHTARYAGDRATDSQNYLKLTKMLELRAVIDRSAAFVCTLVVYEPNGTEHVFTGRLEGQIVRNPLGAGGFGYDPVFMPNGFDKTLAELAPLDKNQISHRAQAVRQFLEKLGAQARAQISPNA
jgi:XTP/dITP diphosphohydrolase